MSHHLRASLWLLILTILICSILYPLVLLGVGQTLFHAQAQGSMAVDGQGNLIGSRLIAQPFTDQAPEYFQPRPSAASYNAAASGASNWGANNPFLRDRVARQLGPMVTRVDGKRVGPDVQEWFREVPDRVAQWAGQNPTLASQWVKGDKVNSAFVEQWTKDHEQAPEFIKWRQENPGQTNPEDLAQPFFASFAREHPRCWITQDDKAEDGKPLLDSDGKPTRRARWVEVQSAEKQENLEVQAYFFDMWLQAHADVPLEVVPADLVMASGSGLDPHITLDNARYQLRHRIAEAWARKLAGEKFEKKLVEQVAEQVEALLQERREAPFGGLVGVDQINVLEVNRELEGRLARLKR